ncbi:MAG: threonine-phosphate decarboxylase [Magnetococcales bacterium]|nr:threonine-phosphate decarboxylase [Magnetococcales bacterium]
MLEHGGGIRRAAAQFGIAVEQWLDLSTGINPQGWPVPPVPDHCWLRLPEEEDGLGQAAAGYYQSESLLALAGTQQAITLLPRLRGPSKVAVLTPTYGEHAHCWRAAGHTVLEWEWPTLQLHWAACDVVVVVNPNNPTGGLLPVELLLSWRQQLQERGGWLVVDEAFMDATPQQSLAPFCGLPGLLVLRSVGKFFGLAGARCGFVLGDEVLLEALRRLAGPWSVCGASRWLVGAALQDQAWIARTRQLLPLHSQRLATLLQAHRLPPDGGTPLFQWLSTPTAALIWHLLAQQGILVRHFPQWNALRFGLPGNEQGWLRLAAALQQLSAQLVPFSSSEDHAHVTP